MLVSVPAPFRERVQHVFQCERSDLRKRRTVDTPNVTFHMGQDLRIADEPHGCTVLGSVRFGVSHSELALSF